LEIFVSRIEFTDFCRREQQIIKEIDSLYPDEMRDTAEVDFAMRARDVQESVNGCDRTYVPLARVASCFGDFE